MHRAYYGVVERGEADFQLSTLQRVSDGLGIKLSTLIESAEETAVTPPRSLALACGLGCAEAEPSRVPP